jgi:hypothetical protein
MEEGLPGDLGAHRGGISLEGRGTDVGGARLQAGDGRLRGAHPRGDLGLRQARRLPSRDQVADQGSPLSGHPPQRHVAEARQRGEFLLVILHTSNDISYLR